MKQTGVISLVLLVISVAGAQLPATDEPKIMKEFDEFLRPWMYKIVYNYRNTVDSQALKLKKDFVTLATMMLADSNGGSELSLKMVNDFCEQLLIGIPKAIQLSPLPALQPRPEYHLETVKDPSFKHKLDLEFAQLATLLDKMYFDQWNKGRNAYDRLEEYVGNAFRPLIPVFLEYLNKLNSETLPLKTVVTQETWERFRRLTKSIRKLSRTESQIGAWGALSPDRE